MRRLNPNAEMFSEIVQYYHTRALQAKPYGYRLGNVINSACHEDGHNFPYVVAEFIKDSELYLSFYMPMQLRGKGYGASYAKEIKIVLEAYNNVKVITFPDCHFSDWLEKNNIPYVMLKGTYVDMPEYVVMSKVYGDDKASRSGLYLMNHVDEGAGIMVQRNASEEAIAAFIAHPMLQDDEHFENPIALKLNDVLKHSSKYTLLLCMEYRKVANAYLCKPETDGWTQEQIKFHCPLIMPEVKEMLIADKVQNYKDFLQFHALTHPRRNELFTYFNNWITYLDCEEFAQKWIAQEMVKIQLPVGMSSRF